MERIANFSCNYVDLPPEVSSVHCYYRRWEVNFSELYLCFWSHSYKACLFTHIEFCQMYVKKKRKKRSEINLFIMFFFIVYRNSWHSCLDPGQSHHWTAVFHCWKVKVLHHLPQMDLMCCATCFPLGKLLYVETRSALNLPHIMSFAWWDQSQIPHYIYTFFKLVIGAVCIWWIHKVKLTKHSGPTVMTIV